MDRTTRLNDHENGTYLTMALQRNHRGLMGCLAGLCLMFCSVANAQAVDADLAEASETIVEIQLKRNAGRLMKVLHIENIKELKDSILNYNISKMEKRSESFRDEFFKRYGVTTVKELQDMDPLTFIQFGLKGQEDRESNKKMLKVTLSDYKIVKKTQVAPDEVVLSFQGNMNYQGTSKPFTGMSGFKKQDGVWKLYFKDMSDYRREKNFEALKKVDDFVKEAEQTKTKQK